MAHVHVLKKYKQGWVFRNADTDETFYLTRDQLMTKGYIPPDPNPRPQSQAPPGSPKVIVIPSPSSPSLLSSSPRSSHSI